MRPLVTLTDLKQKNSRVNSDSYSFLPLYPSSELAEITGMLISDGIVNKWGTLAFVNSDKFLIARWCILLNRVFHKKKTRVMLHMGFKHKKEDFVSRITSTSIVRVLSELGIPLGRRTKQSFHVPLFIREPSIYGIDEMEGSEIQKSFLRAVFTCDGSKPLLTSDKKKPYRNYKMWIRLGFSKDEEIAHSCMEFLNEIKSILNNFGIVTTKIYHYPPRRDFFFNITQKESLLKFYNEIGYSLDCKQNDLEELVRFIRDFEPFGISKKRISEREKKTLDFLKLPRTTIEVQKLIGLHNSKTLDHLNKLYKNGLLMRDRMSRQYIWSIRR